MRLLFAGTPDVALPSLNALIDSDHDVVGVLTRPPAAAGRGRGERRSAVHDRAVELGLPVLTPRSLRDPETLHTLRALAPDCCPVVAYGALVPPDALAIPPNGWVNLHFSLLPSWRGAAPVQHAIRAGDEISGATTFLLDEGLDTGPILGQMTTAIGPRETAGELLARLAQTGADLLKLTIDALAAGDIEPRPQSDEGVSLAPRIEVEDARVDWTLTARAIDRTIRAVTPAPGAWTTMRDQRVKVGPVLLTDDGTLAPGEISAGRREVRVGTGRGDVVLNLVQPQGKREMPALDWLRGVRLEPGERFT